METMALWMAVSILWNLYRYINEENRENCFYFASLLYFEYVLYMNVTWQTAAIAASGSYH